MVLVQNFRKNKKTTEDIELQFEVVRRDYNRDLAKLRKKYQKLFAALALNYNESLQKTTR